MKFRSFGQAGLCSLALAPLLGASVGGFGDSVWSMFIGLAVIFAATGIFIAAQWFRSNRTFRNAQKAETDKISTTLVLLSSAAVLAIYSAGYLRTESAARQFAEQATITATAAPPRAPSPIAPPSADSVAQTAAAPAPRRAGARLPGPHSVQAPSALSPSASSSALAPPAGQDSPASSASAPAAAPSESESPSAQTAEAPPASAPAAPEFIPYKDGIYSGWGYCRHGDIQAQVVVQGGKIVSAEITQCLTRYPCSVIKEAPGQVVSRQSATVDFVSGATQSGYAFHDAVAQALSKAE